MREREESEGDEERCYSFFPLIGNEERGRLIGYGAAAAAATAQHGHDKKLLPTIRKQIGQDNNDNQLACADFLSN